MVIGVVRKTLAFLLHYQLTFNGLLQKFSNYYNIIELQFFTRENLDDAIITPQSSNLWMVSVLLENPWILLLKDYRAPISRL